MRRSGYTNAIQTPITWIDNNVVGSTGLNTYLRDNILAIDNKATPLAQDVIHYSPASTIQVDKITVMSSPAVSVNMLAFSEYSPNIAFSVDFRTSFSNTTASVVWAEAILELSAAHSIEEPSFFRYKMYKTPEWFDPNSSKEPSIGATNYISGAHLGNTNYAFWSGFVRGDVMGNSPFALSSKLYNARTAIVIGATNGTVDLVDPSWALSLRANVASTVQNPSTNYDPGVGIYGQSAF